MLIHFAAAFGGGNAVYTLSGHTNNVGDGVAPYNSTAAFRVGADGLMYEGTSTNGDAVSYTQIDTGTDWVRPASGDWSNHEVRYTNAVGDTGTIGDWPVAEDIWTDLSVDRTIAINSSAEETISVTFDFEIRDAGGNTVATGSYTLGINNFA